MDVLEETQQKDIRMVRGLVDTMYEARLRDEFV